MSPTEVEQLARSVRLDPVDAYSWDEREAWSVVFDEDELELWFGDDRETFGRRLAGLPEAVRDALRVGIECVEWRRERTAEDLRGEIFFTAAMYLDKPRGDELAAMPYDRYRQTNKWRTRAQRTKERFDYRCALCNASGRLHAHHRTYERYGENSTAISLRCVRAATTTHTSSKIGSSLPNRGSTQRRLPDGSRKIRKRGFVRPG